MSKGSKSSGGGSNPAVPKISHWDALGKIFRNIFLTLSVVAPGGETDSNNKPYLI